MATRENLRSLHFHKVCGNNIKLLRNDKVAYRSNGFNAGIAFTDRPVMIGERVFLKIRETETNWSGACRLGFTIRDPLSMKSQLPVHSIPDFVSKPGNWANGLPNSLNTVDSIISFYVNEEGDVYYQRDGGREHLLLTKVNIQNKLWGVIDVYGNTVKVELIPDPSKEYILSNFDATFHSKHGLHVKLEKNKMIASRENGKSLTYVFTCKPMKLDEKVIIKILELDPCIKGPFGYGLTTCDPSKLPFNSLPKNGAELFKRHSEYWNYVEDTCHYECDDIVTFTLKVDELFIVTRNGNAVSTKLCVDASEPLWLFFKLSGTVLKICMMGTSKKKYAELMNEFEGLKLSSPEAKQKMSNELSIGQCVICCDKLIDCTLYRCGHMCMCYDCAIFTRNKFDNCPICRKDIEDVIKCYT